MKANVEILRKEPKRFYCSSGETDRPLYVMDDDHLINAGFENTQELIDSYEDSCDLKLIIERVAAGEYDLLTKQRGMFIDTTVFPTAVCDLKNQIRESIALYDTLPDDIKKEIGSYEKFSKWDDNQYKQWIDLHIVEPITPDIPVPFESEVKE